MGLFSTYRIARMMSSSVESIESLPHSRSTISSTIAPPSRMPCSWMRVQISCPYCSSSRAVSSGSSHFGLPCLARSSSCASQSLTISACASSKASSIVSSEVGSPPASIIVSASFVPTTMRSRVESFSTSGSVGLMVSRPSIIPIRTAPTGPRNGSGEIISAAEAPLMHRMSCAVIRSAESTVQMTCTSFL